MWEAAKNAYWQLWHLKTAFVPSLAFQNRKRDDASKIVIGKTTSDAAIVDSTLCDVSSAIAILRFFLRCCCDNIKFLRAVIEVSSS